MKEFIKNKKNVIISFSIVLVGILLIGSAFVIDYYETQKVVVPVKSGDSKEIPIKEVEPEEEKPVDNPTSNRDFCSFSIGEIGLGLFISNGFL